MSKRKMIDVAWLGEAGEKIASIVTAYLKGPRGKFDFEADHPFDGHFSVTVKVNDPVPAAEADEFEFYYLMSGEVRFIFESKEQAEEFARKLAEAIAKA